jgi:hypothetical protein
MTYRERREAKAERLHGWAAKREADAARVFKRHEVYRGDTAFNTQPGHIPERARVNRQDERAYESRQKARGMESRASGIESQLAGAIYSDDPDAIPALEARLAKLEAKRDRIKADNAAFRKAVKAAGVPKSEMPYSWQGGKFQGHTLHADFELTNLGGDITRNRKRLEDLRRQAGRRAPAAPVPLAWEPSREVRGLQGAMIPDVPVHRVVSGNVVQEGLFRRGLAAERRRRVRQANTQRRRRDGRFR